MHFLGITIAGLCFDYTAVKIGCLLDRDVFAAYKKKLFCRDICIYIICEELQVSFTSLEATRFTLNKWIE